MNVVELHPEDLLEKEARGEISAVERERLDAHVARCLACTLERQLRADFADELAADPEPGARTLADEVDEPAPSSRRPRRRPLRVAWLAAAAALLIVGGATARELGLLSSILGAPPPENNAAPVHVSDPPRPTLDPPRRAGPTRDGVSPPSAPKEESSPTFGPASPPTAAPLGNAWRGAGASGAPRSPDSVVADPPTTPAAPVADPASLAPATPAASSTALLPAIAPGSRAYVEVGLIHTAGVSAVAVRSKLRSLQAPLSACYRAEMMQVPDPGTRTATLHINVDEGGRVTACAVSGVEALPETARCFQRTVLGQDLGTGAMQAKSGSAEAWLTLHPL